MTNDVLAPFVRNLARGPSRSRNLTREESATALAACLTQEAAPEAVGALFMLMRYRGENADEIAGFVDALRDRNVDWSGAGAAIDWPSYAAGKSRGLPLFLLAARLVADAGYPVLLHGWNSHLSHPAAPLACLNVVRAKVVSSPDEARTALKDGLAYAPLSAIDASAFRLLKLRDVLGLRSPLNTALRAFNPAGANVTVQGVFHPSYRELQTESASLLGQQSIGVIKGGGGEFERHPGKSIALYGYNNAGPFDFSMPPTTDTPPRRLKGEELSVTALSAIWSGAVNDAFSTKVVTSTAGAVLFIAGAADSLAATEVMALQLWKGRQK